MDGSLDHTDGGEPGALPAPPLGAFVGRSNELRLLDRLRHQAALGVPGQALVLGPAGIGKTRLVGEFLGRARAAGARTALGTCTEDLSIPFLPVATLVASLGQEAAAVARALEPGAVPVADPLAASADRGSGPVLEACRAVLSAAARQPLVVVLEDLHWADGRTADFVAALTAAAEHEAQLGPVPLLVVVTARPVDERSPAGRRLARLRDDPAGRVLELGGLDELGLNELLTTLLPARPARSLLQALAEATDGNPLLVRSLVGRLAAGGTLLSTGGVVRLAAGVVLPQGPVPLDDELLRRLEVLGPVAAALAERAACLGDDQALDDLAGTADLEAQSFEAALDELVAARVLRDDGDRYRFDHPQVRQAVYGRLSERHRRRLHLEAAAYLEQRHGPGPARALERYHHLRRAGPAGEARLGQVAEQAADQAFALAAYGRAAQAYEVALAAGSEADPDRLTLVLKAVLSHFRDHDLPALEPLCAEAARLARELGDLEREALAALTLVRAQLTIGPGSVGGGTDATPVEAVLVEARRVGNRRVAGEAAGLLAEARFHAFDFSGGDELLAAARADAAASDDVVLLTAVEFAAGLQHLGRVELADAERCLRASLAAARRQPDPWQQTWGLGRLVLVRFLAGDLAEARSIGAEAQRVAGANQDWAEQCLAAAVETGVAAAQDRHADAEVLGQLAARLYHRSDYAFAPALLFPSLAAARAARGDLTGALEALDVYASLGGRGLAPLRLLARAVCGDTAGLREAPPFRPVGGQPQHLLSLVTLGAQAEVAITLDAADLAADAVAPLERLYAAGLRWTPAWPLAVARLVAGLHRVLGHHEEAAGWAARAEAELTASGAGGEAALAALERALAERAAGRSRGALDAATRAVIGLDAAGRLPALHHAEELAGGRPGTRVLRVVLVTDMVSSTARNVAVGDERYVALLDRHDRIVRQRLRRHDGVEFKHTGDGFCAWFTSAASAVQCCFGIREDLATHNAAHPHEPLHVRFGLAAGRPIERSADLYGITVALATRVCAEAGPGQVLVADGVPALAGAAVQCRPVGARVLKGLPQPVPLFAAEPAG